MHQVVRRQIYVSVGGTFTLRVSRPSIIPVSNPTTQFQSGDFSRGPNADEQETTQEKR